MKYVKIVIIL